MTNSKVSHDTKTMYVFINNENKIENNNNPLTEVRKADFSTFQLMSALFISLKEKLAKTKVNMLLPKTN